MSGLFTPNILCASGNAWTLPWSVIAIDFIPHFIARFIKFLTGVIPSIVLIWVCIWSSTLFNLALSILSWTFSSGISIIVFTKTPNCFAYGSNWAVPAILTFAAPFSLFFKLSTFSGAENTLQSIVLVPSYTLKITKNLPDFSSLNFIPRLISSSFASNSTLNIFPSITTFPLSTPTSVIFVIDSFKFKLLP